MKRNIFLLAATAIIISLSLLSCMSKEEKEKKRQEAAKIEREHFVNDSITAEEVRIAREKIRKLEQLQDSAKKAKRIEDVKHSVKLTSYYLSSPNSASGVSANLYYKNLSDKVIKYFVWTGYPINSVGDVVSCTIRDYSKFSGKDTGPVKKGASGGGNWDCAWYNWEAKKLILTKVAIEYMDGSSFEIEGNELYLIGKKKD